MRRKLDKRLHFLIPAFILIITNIGACLLIANSSATNTAEYDTNSFANSNPTSEMRPIAASQGVIDKSDNNILYWVQISDIHINMEEKSQLDAFESFCNETIQTVSPNFVIATGDIIDGEKVEHHQRFQKEEEYQFFRNTLDSNNMNDSFWYSTVGNHEKYNVEHNYSLYHKYISNETDYTFSVNTTFGKYRFVNIDTTQVVGTANPFNLFGEMNETKLNTIESLISEPASNFNQTIFTGHHPVTQQYMDRSTSGKNLNDLMNEAETTAYLTGHVHREDFYRMDGEIIEIMAPSFTDFTAYRICAIDNDIFSFSEAIQGNWPAGIITNPTDSRFYSTRSPLIKMRTDQELRTLIFDPNPSTISAVAKIDGVSIGNLTNKEGNLWTINWDPSKYSSKKHTLTIEIISSSGKDTQEIEFNLSDFTPTRVSSLGYWVLNAPLQIFTMLFAATFFLIAFGRLAFPKIWAKMNPEKYETYAKSLHGIGEDEFNTFFKKHFTKHWVQAASLPTRVKVLLMSLPILYLFAPVINAEVLPDQLGYIWLWGMRISGTFLHTFYTFIFVGIYLISFLQLEWFVTRRYNNPDMNLFGKLSFLLSIAWLIGITWFLVIYFGFGVILVNPFLIYQLFVIFYCSYLVSNYKYDWKDNTGSTEDEEQEEEQKE
jgi:Icc-related predicted phosphoesterase